MVISSIGSATADERLRDIAKVLKVNREGRHFSVIEVRSEGI